MGQFEGWSILSGHRGVSFDWGENNCSGADFGEYSEIHRRCNSEN